MHTQCPDLCHTHMHCVQVLCYPDTHTPCLGSYLYKHAVSRISLAQTHIHCVQDLTQTHTCTLCVQDFAYLDANAHTPCDWNHALTCVYSVWNLTHTVSEISHRDTHTHTLCGISLTHTHTESDVPESCPIHTQNSSTVLPIISGAASAACPSLKNHVAEPQGRGQCLAGDAQQTPELGPG